MKRGVQFNFSYLTERKDVERKLTVSFLSQSNHDSVEDYPKNDIITPLELIEKWMLLSDKYRCKVKKDFSNVKQLRGQQNSFSSFRNVNFVPRGPSRHF